MLFPTIEFFIFFIIVFTLAWLFNRFAGPRKIILLIASYFFYGWWDWRFVFLLFGCSFISYICAITLEHFRPVPGRAVKADNTKVIAILVLTLVLELGVLAFFKYYTFLTTNLNNLFLLIGYKPVIPSFSIILPVGISFFTFQSLSYVVDVYRGDYKPYRNLVDVLLYVSFFPQLVAGPIVRAHDFLPQLSQKPILLKTDISRAILLIMGGMIKKVLIANYLGTSLADPVFLNPSAYSSLELLFGLYAYAVQIFCDFSAYSDMAIGIALFFGYKFEPNFNSPYRAITLQDFWRRWHISLSTWLRDYLYISLGGNRKGRLKTYRNLSLTMILGGLWHGPSWNFVLWGALHGVGLAIERWIGETFGKRKKKPSVAGQILRWMLTFHIVCLSWLLFRSPSLGIAGDYLSGLFKFTGGLQLAGPFLLSLIAVGMIIHFLPKEKMRKAVDAFARLPLEIQALSLSAALFLLSATALEGVAPFIYFQF